MDTFANILIEARYSMHCSSDFAFLSTLNPSPTEAHIMTIIRVAVGFLLLAVAGPVAWGDSSDPKPLFVEGYAGQMSYKPGEELALHVSTTASVFSIEIARLGAKTEVVHAAANVPGVESPIPENASTHGCGWPALVKLAIPETWKSGYYQVTFKAADGGGKFVQRGRRTAEATAFFIVRAAKPGASTKTLIQLSTNTYNAYNNWGGFSLYGYHGRANVPGHRVTFQRPSAGQFGQWELPFVAWAEANGYVFDYAANSDLEFHPEELKAYKLVLSVGHDEYWSSLMRDHLEAFIKAGGNVAFFSGNTCCWQVRSEDQGQALTCWKQWYNLDPAYRDGNIKLLTTAWSHELIGRPENQLTGVGFLFGGYHRSHGQFMDGASAFTVHRPEHWALEGTGLKRGDSFGGKDTIVGYECDGCEFELRDGLPVPTHRDGTPKGFTILGTCPAKWAPGDSLWYDKFPTDRVGSATMGLYTQGGTVFTVGTTDWSHGLRGKDAAVERITKNVLDRLGK